GYSGTSSQTIADTAECATGVVVASNASTPPGGTMIEPSKSSLEPSCIVCIATAVAVKATFSAEPPKSAEPNLTASAFVIPVTATFVMSRALPPVACRVERLNGCAPVVMIPLPTDVAHTKPPGPVAASAVITRLSDASTMARLTP